MLGMSLSVIPVTRSPSKYFPKHLESGQSFLSRLLHLLLEAATLSQSLQLLDYQCTKKIDGCGRAALNYWCQYGVPAQYTKTPPPLGSFL